jgi:hypothetical protein
MAYERNLVSQTFKSAADYSTDEANQQYHFLELNSSGEVVRANAATDNIVGVLQNKPRSGASATVGVSGVSKVKLGGTVAIGDAITTDSAGKGIATTTSGNTIAGRALAAGVSGDIIPVLLAGLRTAV